MTEETFFEAVARNDGDAVRGGLEASPSLLDARDPETGGTALHAAVAADAQEVAAILVEAGVDMDARNRQGRTALHDAIEDGRASIRELLIGAGAEVDVCAAAILGDLERLETLLDEDPRRANERSTGLSPLCWAAFGFSTEAARLLLDRGARMDDGELLCAASVGRVPMGKLLLDRGADPDELHPEAGANALHEAARMRYSEDGADFVRLLLDHGADPSLRTRAGKTALELALEGRERQSGSGFEGWSRNWDGVIALLREPRPPR